MSGQTIRDVVVRIAIEMAQSKVRAPDMSAVDKEMKRIKDEWRGIWSGTYGPGMGTANVSGGGRGGGPGPNLPTSHPDFIGPKRPVSNDVIRSRLVELRAMSLMLSGQEQVLKRVKLAEDALTESVKRGVSASRARSAALTQLVASHEGILGIPNGSARIASMIPAKAGIPLALAAVAATAGPVDRMMRRGDAREFMANGGAFSANTMIDTSLFGNPYLAADAEKTGQLVARPRGLMSRISSGATSFSNFFTGLGDEEGIFQQDVGNSRAFAAETQAQRAEMLRLQGIEARSGFYRTSQNSLLETGNISTQDALDNLNSVGAARRAAILQRPGNEVNVGLGDLRRGAAAAEFDVKDAQERVRLQQRMVQELESERNKILENTRLANAQVDIERDRLRATQERLGGASSGDIGRLKGIARKVGAGQELSVEEAKIARQFGVADQEAARAFEKRFQASFTPEEQQNLGLGKDLAQAEKDLAAAFRDQRDALPDISQEIADATKSMVETIQKLPELMETMRKAFEALNEAQRQIEEQAKKNQEKDVKKRGS